PAEEVKKVEPKAETPKKTRKKSASKKGKVLIGRGKRKESIARATIKNGKGRLTFNSLSVQSLNNRYIKDIIREPLKFLSPEELTTIDVKVNVNGGGVMGQAQAARTAIANAIVQYFDSKDLEKRMLEFDRSLLIADPRRVESKKFKGPKARARFQKSYR
ncbi:30S ribosomal protein S9, partial [Candidatus Micrarchaeota archaeon]|nr:30S ribosomal protein S9 [Candidatus Micrarchaeota archaeon]